MKNLIQRFIREEEGQDLIEYALLTFLIAVGLALTLTAVGDRVAAIFGEILTDLGG
jgi:Flp pilus assembly pilin Flp